ncbi:hypothetical protein GGR50DRAFT_335333 [Xylaria sp. CBS 124048]|nr:hypothetical protein GGR50DRAFT_335333 [Xylaria sp. CBS 124048]
MLSCLLSRKIDHQQFNTQQSINQFNQSIQIVQIMQSHMHTHKKTLNVRAATQTIPKSVAVASKGALLPTLAWLVAASAVGFYVSRQLNKEAGSFDRIFSQQNTPEVEQSRKKVFAADASSDPRTSLFNVLGWTR